MRFHYSAISPGGVRVKVTSQHRAMRSSPSSRPAAGTTFKSGRLAGSGPPTSRRRRSSSNFIVTFSTQLSVYVRAGVPIVQALDAIASGANNKSRRLIVTDIVSQLREGSRLSAAMALHPEAFSGFYVAAAQLGGDDRSPRRDPHPDGGTHRPRSESQSPASRRPSSTPVLSR